MKDTIKLHSAARKYCIERGYFWRNEYSQMCAESRDRKEDCYNYTDEAYDMFPRYQVLEAILTEVEKHKSDDFESIAQAKSQLISDGLSAESLFTKPSNSEAIVKIITDELEKGTFAYLPQTKRVTKLFELAEVKAKEFPKPRNNEIKEIAMNEERQLFIKFINDITEAELYDIEPMFYRRVISRSESDFLRKKLSDRWCVAGSYWYPLVECNREDVVALKDDFFYKDQDIGTLRDILKKRGINRIWELREFDTYPGYEIDTDAFYPCYTIEGEGYWFSNDMDWVIYASHENSITIAGTWLIDEVMLAWEDWKQRIWLEFTY